MHKYEAILQTSPRSLGYNMAAKTGNIDDGRYFVVFMKWKITQMLAFRDASSVYLGKFFLEFICSFIDAGNVQLALLNFNTQILNDHDQTLNIT